MRINVNPNAKASGDFGYVAEGEYRLRVAECKWMQGPKAPYLNWSFEFVDPNVKCVNEGQQVGKVYEITTLKEDAQFALHNVLDALGIEWGDFDTDEVKGIELDAKVGLETYDGKIKNVIDKYIARS